MSRPDLKKGGESRLHITLPHPVWRELSMYANRDDMRIQDVAVQAIKKYLNSVPPAERPQSLGAYGTPKQTPLIKVKRKRYYDSPVEVPVPVAPVLEGIEECAEVTQEQWDLLKGPVVDAPPPPPPTWSEIWKRLKDHLHEGPAWDELQSYLKGVTPPNDILQWKFDRQVAWFNAYAPLGEI